MHPTPPFGEHRGYSGGTLRSAHALRAVRHFVWLGVGSDKMALSRPGRAPGWCPIPPASTPEGAYPQGAAQTPAVGQSFLFDRSLKWEEASAQHG
jgi:hypothetical protein